MDDFHYNVAAGLDLYVPDPTGKRTWVFNDRDPELLRSLQAVRDMVNADKSAYTSVSLGWNQWHQEFDASRAAMISSWAAHIPRESLESDGKFGNGTHFRDLVGIAPFPNGSAGLSALKPETNPIGFDPTLTPEQLEAAFEWCKSWFYGDIFVNLMRTQAQKARALGRTSSVYVTLLTLPYTTKDIPLDKPMAEVFPPDYLRMYKSIREAHAPPLPREFGLREPPRNDLDRATRAMYSEAITSGIDLKALIAKTAELMNTNLLNFSGKEDRERMRRYIAARGEFYRRYFPRFYREVWTRRTETYYRAP
jgi:ABC-type glycerol-3-phosphate transport system substrate-binding protein